MPHPGETFHIDPGGAVAKAVEGVVLGGVVPLQQRPVLELGPLHHPLLEVLVRQIQPQPPPGIVLDLGPGDLHSHPLGQVEVGVHPDLGQQVLVLLGKVLLHVAHVRPVVEQQAQVGRVHIVRAVPEYLTVTALVQPLVQLVQLCLAQAVALIAGLHPGGILVIQPVQQHLIGQPFVQPGILPEKVAQGGAQGLGIVRPVQGGAELGERPLAELHGDAVFMGKAGGVEEVVHQLLHRGLLQRGGEV